MKRYKPILIPVVILLFMLNLSTAFAEQQYTEDLCVDQTKASASTVSGQGEGAEKAFDNTVDVNQYSGNTWYSRSLPSIIQYDFENSANIIKQYSVKSHAYDLFYSPKSWTFEASNDGQNWIVLDTVVGAPEWTSNERRYYPVMNDKSYRYYGLRFTERQGAAYTNMVMVNEIEMMADGAIKTKIINIEPEKSKIRVNETVKAMVVIDNISEIAAEDIRIAYDATKLKFEGYEEASGIKLVKNLDKEGELRVIVASLGKDQIVNAKKVLLNLNFKGISVGEAKVDVIKARVSDGLEMEKDLTDEECGEATIIIEAPIFLDVNKSGEFTLLDLAIDARHFAKDPKLAELLKYNTDVVVNDNIDNGDLLEIGQQMLLNVNYKF